MNANVDHLHEEKRIDRTTRVLAAGFVAVLSVFSCAAVLFHQPTWPAAAAVATEAAIVTVFCHVMLRQD